MAWQLPRAFSEWVFTFAAGKFVNIGQGTWHYAPEDRA